MKRVNIHDAKNNPSDAIALRDKVVRQPRIGAAAGQFEIPDSFFDPLPDEILKSFTGK